MLRLDNNGLASVFLPREHYLKTLGFDCGILLKRWMKVAVSSRAYLLKCSITYRKVM